MINKLRSNSNSPYLIKVSIALWSCFIFSSIVVSFLLCHYICQYLTIYSLWICTIFTYDISLHIDFIRIINYNVYKYYSKGVNEWQIRSRQAATWQALPLRFFEIVVTATTQNLLPEVLCLKQRALQRARKNSCSTRLSEMLAHLVLSFLRHKYIKRIINL